MANIIAKILNGKYIGEYSPNLETQPNDFWVLHGPISPSTASSLGIVYPNFLGGIIDPLHSQKSVFHSPLNDPEVVPDNFPFQFSKSLVTNQIVLPGYVAFSKKDIYRAYDLLSKAKIVSRWKNPLFSSGREQYRIYSKSMLDSLIIATDETLLKKYGIILEANVLEDANKEGCPLSLSGGYLDLSNKIYSYVGEMKFGETGHKDRYLGTSLISAIGKPQELMGNVPEKFNGEIKMLQAISESLPLLPNFCGTRINLNFVSGKIEQNNGKIGPQVLAATEPTYRPGGATVAELYNVQRLLANPSQKVVTAQSKIHYGPRNETMIPSEALVILDEIVTRGNRGPVQVWAEPI